MSILKWKIMRNIATKSTFLILLLGLQGCDYLWNFFEPEFNIKEKDYVAGIVDGDPEPPYATPQMSKSSLLGVDKDNDGVRDDIEIWINRNVDEEILRKYLKTYTKRLVYNLTCTNHEECLNAWRMRMRTSECYSMTFSGENDQRKVYSFKKVIDKLYFNNDAKKNKKNNGFTASSSMVWSGSDYLGLYLLRNKFCDFEIQWDEAKLKDVWSYSNRVRFVRNIQEGLYEKNFNIHVNITDYSNLCEGFDGPNEKLCD